MTGDPAPGLGDDAGVVDDTPGGFIARVRGRVQAVGFRAWVWSHASRLELGGYVRNLPDGAVEVGARGAPEALERLEDLLWRGPAQAHVEAVSIEWREVAGPARFEVKF